MIKQFKDYDQTQSYGDYEKLPKGDMCYASSM